MRSAADVEVGANIGSYNPGHSGKPMKGVDNTMYGKRHTADTRKKMSERHTDVSGTKIPKPELFCSLPTTGISYVVGII